MGLHPVELEDLILAPWTYARTALDAHPLRLHVLTPPYPSIARGTLRVLRIAEARLASLREPQGDCHPELVEGAPIALHVTAGYDGYERIA